MTIDYDGRVFRPVVNEHGEVTGETVFVYRQRGQIVWAEYSGGAIITGHLLGTVDEDGRLDFSYHQINDAGQLRTGVCRSTPEVLPDGRLRLHEQWRWTSGDGGTGTSTVEEFSCPFGDAVMPARSSPGGRSPGRDVAT